MSLKNIGTFDVIGPNMIGPSSSHTAGALKIALLAGKMISGKIKNVKFILYGSFAKTYRGHGTDRALIGGILGFSTDEPRIKDSFIYAKIKGLEYSFIADDVTQVDHPNTVDIIITNDKLDVTRITGVSTGGGEALITRINDVDISLTGAYNTIFVTQIDAPGVVAYITNCLNKYKINIAFMKLFRESRGKLAYTVIELDEAVPNNTICEIESFEYIKSAMLIEV